MEDDEVVVDDTDPVVEESVELDVGEAEEIDPLTEAIQRAETAEKEITYRDAEIQNVRKRLMSEKATAIQYGGMGIARKMLAVLRCGQNYLAMELQKSRQRAKNSTPQRWKRLPHFHHLTTSQQTKSSMS